VICRSLAANEAAAPGLPPILYSSGYLLPAQNYGFSVSDTLEGGSGAGVTGVGVMGCSHSQSVVPSYSSGIVTTGSLGTYPDYGLTGCSHSQSLVPSYSLGIVTTGSLGTYSDYGVTGFSHSQSVVPSSSSGILTTGSLGTYSDYGVTGCSHSQSVVPSSSSGIVTTGSLGTYLDYALDENQAVSRTQFFLLFFLVYTPFPGGSLRL